jgi:hypothetical protein
MDRLDWISILKVICGARSARDPTNATYKQIWQGNIPSDLKNMPRVRAVAVFDSTGTTDTHIDTSANP